MFPKTAQEQINQFQDFITEIKTKLTLVTENDYVVAMPHNIGIKIINGKAQSCGIIHSDVMTKNDAIRTASLLTNGNGHAGKAILFSDALLIQIQELENGITSLSACI